MIDQSPIEPSREDSNETGPGQRKPNLISGYQSIDSFVPIDVGIAKAGQLQPNQYINKGLKKPNQQKSYDEAGALASRVSAPHLGLGQNYNQHRVSMPNYNLNQEVGQMKVPVLPMGISQSAQNIAKRA